MADEQLEQLYDLFHEISALPEDERESALRERCGDDTRMIHDLQALLMAAAGVPAVPDNAEQPTSLEPEPSSPPLKPPEPDFPERIGGYTVLRTIEEGGMGVVYEAEQSHPRRRVALKVLKSGISSPSALRRFEHEAQLLGRLHHPAIAQVFEAGIHATAIGADVPFIAMEIVDGAMTIRDYAERRTLGTRQRLDLVATVCDAVEHAHRNGIIHRDLKPGNILVDASGQVKVLDFGIARAVDSDVRTATLRTDLGQLIGTVPYMSPEQAAGDPADLDTRSDVYSLGVVAYELLTGRLPYDVERRLVHEVVRIIREVEPTPISAVNRALRGDVETIVGRALEKDKNRRYQSAGELAADIRRYLHDEPILARPPTLRYQFRKFTKRNPVLVGATGLVLLLLVTGTAVTTALAIGQTRARAEAERQERISKEVVTFLNEEVLGTADPDEARYRDLTLLDALEQAGGRIEGRFDDPLVEASIRVVMGNVFAKAGRVDLAQSHLERALELQRTAQVPADPNLLITTARLGMTRMQQRRPEEAEAILEPTVAAMEEALGPNDRNTLGALGNLVIVYLMQGRLAEAEPMLVDLLERQRRVLGESHPHTLNSLSNVAHVALDLGKLETADQRFRDALEAQRTALGENHRITLTTTHNLAVVCQQREKYEEAETLYRQALEGRRQLFSPEHPFSLETAFYLAELLTERGRPEEAEPLLLETWNHLEQIDHPDPQLPDKVARALAAAYRDLDRPAEASQWQALTTETDRKAPN